MRDLYPIFQLIDSLSPDQIQELTDYLAHKESSQARASSIRQAGLNRGVILFISDDFDAELPSEFWLGE